MASGESESREPPISLRTATPPSRSEVARSMPLAGGKDYIDALRGTGLIRYIRNSIDGSLGIVDPRTVDPFRVPCLAFPESATAADYIAFVEQVKRAGGMGVIVFHGVGGDWLKVSNEAHRGLLRYLKEHEREVWTAPFQTVMDFAMRGRG